MQFPNFVAVNFDGLVWRRGRDVGCALTSPLSSIFYMTDCCRAA